MPIADYNEIVQREIVPGLIDTVIYDKLEPLVKWFQVVDPIKGDRITNRYRLGHTSNAAFYDKSDVDVAPATQVLKKPYWDKIQAQGYISVHNIDISNDAPGDNTIDMIKDQISLEVAAIADLHQAAFFTRIKNDVDSTSVAYSDASLSRSTYPLLASYEEATDATITLAYMRTMMQTVTLNKGVNLSDYVGCQEGSVYYTFKPLAAALHTLNMVTMRGVPQDMGYPDVANFEGLDLAPPSDFTNMTTGDVFMLRRQDVKITPTMPLRIEAKQSGADTIDFGIYMGSHIRVDNPYLQGKMTDKD